MISFYKIWLWFHAKHNRLMFNADAKHRKASQSIAKHRKASVLGSTRYEQFHNKQKVVLCNPRFTGKARPLCVPFGYKTIKRSCPRLHYLWLVAQATFSLQHLPLYNLFFVHNLLKIIPQFFTKF